MELTICNNGCIKLSKLGRKRKMPDGFLDLEREFACSDFAEFHALATIIHRFREGMSICAAGKLECFFLKLLFDFCGKEVA